MKGDGHSDLPPKNSHEALLIRLKSRAARLEAEKHRALDQRRRDFIHSYWQSMYADDDSTLSDAHLDSLLTGLEKKSEELKLRSEDLCGTASPAVPVLLTSDRPSSTRRTFGRCEENGSKELQLEAKEAERRLEHVNSLHLGRASDLELQAMNAFERSQRRIQEDWWR
eukprot:g2631.t1